MGGIMNGDPQVAAGGNGTIYTTLRDSGGVVWYRGYTEGTSGGWQSWVITGGVLQNAAPAASGGELYVVAAREQRPVVVPHHGQFNGPILETAGW